MVPLLAGSVLLLTALHLTTTLAVSPPTRRVQGCPDPLVRESLPQLCGELPDLEESRCLVLVTSASLEPGYTFMVGGVEYSIAVRGANRKVVYIGTSDRSFETPEHLTVSHRFADAKEVSLGDLSREPGWGYFLELPSGWFAAFFTGDTATEWEPSDETPIRWFFRRKSCLDESG